MRHAIATLQWRTEKEGGRRAAVTARRYMSPVVFANDTASGQAWTLVVDRGRSAPGAKETVLVHFLMDDAPHEVLTAGTAFQLVEGSRIVAEGEVSDVFELSVAA